MHRRRLELALEQLAQVLNVVKRAATQSDPPRREGAQALLQAAGLVAIEIAACEPTSTRPQANRKCENCGKPTRLTTAGCDHCDLEDK